MCACVYAARMLGCKGDDNAGGIRGRCGCGECVYGWHTWFSLLSSAGDVLEMRGSRRLGGVMSACCEFGFFMSMAGPGICVLC